MRGLKIRKGGADASTKKISLILGEFPTTPPMGLVLKWATGYQST